MTDPTKQPGYRFASLRLARGHFEYVSEAPRETQGTLAVNYQDRVEVLGTTVVLWQSIQVSVADPEDESRVFYTVFAELAARFEGHGEQNLTPDDFGQNHAPAIVFPYTREWIHRLTSSADPWPPLLLPPMNVLQLRAQAAQKPDASTSRA